jgi:DNA-binding response OmpR family regulator
LLANLICSSDIKICIVAEDETIVTRALDYGADEFMAKPIGVETIVYKMIMLLTTKYAQHLIMIYLMLLD